MIVFLWKMCNKCLPVRQKLHKRVQNISLICPMCHNEEEKLEHLLLLCPFARAVWFGSELSIRTDSFTINDIKDWIQEWLMKPDLTQPKAAWFYAQFVCTLWCLWIHRNEVIFKNQSPNPTRVILHQRVLLRGILNAI